MARQSNRIAEFADLRVKPSRGLSPHQAADRLARYGPNVLATEPAGGLLRRLVQPFTDPMVVILLAAGAVFFALGERRDGAIMFAAAVPVIVVDMILEIRAERTLARLRELAAPRATVRRSGREVQISSHEVVPGDVVLLKEGEVVPADGVVESESNFQVDESSLTGESLPVSKHGIGWPALGPLMEDRGARVFAGTTVLAGRATVIVTATGSRTEYGEIGRLVAQARPQQTPIQRAIGDLVRILAVAAVAASVAVAAIEIARGQGWVNALLAGVSLAIAAIPEEFSIVFAIYLTLGAWRMARRNALVRRLTGVEALGSTTVICTDKTGTLTQGRLAVEGLFVGGQLHIGPRPVSDPAINHLLENALLASEPHPFDPLDQAISALAKEIGLDPDMVYSRWTMAQDYPFDPLRKYVTHVWRSPEGDLRLCSKGSIEGILELSIPPEPQRKAVQEANHELSGRGMRVIAVAERKLGQVAPQRWANETGMQLVGLIGFADPLRPGVRRAVTECQSAGVRVIMITGDHPLTAHAVAEATGLYHEDQLILTGPEVQSMDDVALRQALGNVGIFARVLPAQKFRIVEGLRALQQVVAVTGDGINDAPALRAADIGVAMGRRGTQVAREAATMVLMDDNFGTIVEAIKEGRKIFDSLRHAFIYLMTFHFPIVLGTLLIPLMGAPLLLLPVHLVWLELIIHPTASLVFEADPPDPDLMQRPPRNPREPFLPPKTGLWVVGEGTAIFMGILVLYLWLLSAGIPIDQARAAGIATLVMAQTILVLQSRSPDKPFWWDGMLQNRVLVPTTLLTLASLVLMVYLDPLAAAAQFSPPTPIQWAVSGLAALASTVPFDLLKLWKGSGTLPGPGGRSLSSEP